MEIQLTFYSELSERCPLKAILHFCYLCDSREIAQTENWNGNRFWYAKKRMNATTNRAAIVALLFPVVSSCPATTTTTRTGKPPCHALTLRFIHVLSNWASLTRFRAPRNISKARIVFKKNVSRTSLRKKETARGSIATALRRISPCLVTWISPYGIFKFVFLPNDLVIA